MAGRLFEGFQQGIECRCTEHVNFIDDVNFVCAVGRHVFDIVPQFPNLVDAVVGGTVDFKTSTPLPVVISRQDWHSSQGVGVGPSAQFIDLARIRGTVVFPVPRGPVNKIAWAMRFAVMALDRVRVM